jgi:hypothetical protein
LLLAQQAMLSKAQIVGKWVNKKCRQKTSFLFKNVATHIQLIQFDSLGWISYSNLCHTREICALCPSVLHKFTLIWHHEYGPCAQLIAFSPRFGCALCFMPCAQLLLNLPLVDFSTIKDNLLLLFLFCFLHWPSCDLLNLALA